MLGQVLAIFLVGAGLFVEASLTTSYETTWTTVTITTSVRQTVLALDGFIQRIVVSIDNGNGHLWDYSSDEITALQLLTIHTTYITDCPVVTELPPSAQVKGRIGPELPRIYVENALRGDKRREALEKLIENKVIAPLKSDDIPKFKGSGHHTTTKVSLYSF